jgi:hypothetical protein
MTQETIKQEKTMRSKRPRGKRQEQTRYGSIQDMEEESKLQEQARYERRKQAARARS